MKSDALSRLLVRGKPDAFRTNIRDNEPFLKGSDGITSITLSFLELPALSLMMNRRRSTAHWSGQARETRDELVKWMALLHGKPLMRFQWARVTISLVFPDRRRRDLDGLMAACKPLIDALVRRGYLPGDHYDVLPRLTIEAVRNMGGRGATTVLFEGQPEKGEVTGRDVNISTVLLGALKIIPIKSTLSHHAGQEIS